MLKIGIAMGLYWEVELMWQQLLRNITTKHSEVTMSNNKETAAQIILVLMVIILIVWAFKNDKFKPKEHRVTDTIIYWNGEKLINESP